MLHISTPPTMPGNHRAATVTALLAFAAVLALLIAVPAPYAVFILFSSGIILVGGGVLLYAARERRRQDDY